MKILIGCEYSGIVSQAFKSKGHDVTSCDLLDSELSHDRSHYKGNIFDIVPGSFDMLIAFPPCTYLAKSQFHLHSSPGRKEETIKAVKFVDDLWKLDIEMIAIENPIGYLNKNWLPPSQITNCRNYGSIYGKEICLWLKNLPPLIDTYVSSGRKKVSNHVNSRMSQADKSKIKSRFFPEMAEAMATQWNF